MLQIMKKFQPGLKVPICKEEGEVKGNKSVENTGTRKAMKTSTRMVNKNKPASVFSIMSGPESSKQYTEITTNET